MNCEEFEEVAGAFALGALPERERKAAEAHLASCDKHPEARELLALASSLALASPPMDPPAALKSRLMEAVRAESVQPREAPLHDTPGPNRLSVLKRWFAGARFGYGLAAVMTVVIIGLLAWNISLQSGNGAETRVVAMTGQISGQVVYVTDQKVAFMELRGLSTLPSDKVYEVWALSKTNAVSLGTITPAGGEAKAAMQFDASQYDNIAVTIERAPGVDQPTTPPITISEEF